MILMQNFQILDNFYELKSVDGRHEHLSWVCDHVIDAEYISNGHILEFGVAGAGTMRILESKFSTPIHGFDTWEGLPEAWNINPIKYPKGQFSTNGTLPTVNDNVTLIKGLFENTLPHWVEQNNTPIKFIHIDCDLYAGARTILYTLNDIIVPGTVIAFDELANWSHNNWSNQPILEHEWKALNEWSTDHNRSWYPISRSNKFQASIMITA